MAGWQIAERGTNKRKPLGSPAPIPALIAPGAGRPELQKPGSAQTRPHCSANARVWRNNRIAAANRKPGNGFVAQLFGPAGDGFVAQVFSPDFRATDLRGLPLILAIAPTANENVGLICLRVCRTHNKSTTDPQTRLPNANGKPSGPPRHSGAYRAGRGKTRATKASQCSNAATMFE